MSRRKSKSPPPPNRWTIVFVVLCLAGLALSADLLRVHVAAHTQPDYVSYCTVSEGLDCAAVALSEYSVMLGLPLAVWGLIAYAALGLLAWMHRRAKRPTWHLPLAFAGSVVMALGGIVLYGISHFVIRSVCLVCAGSYLVSIGLAVVGFLALRHDADGSPGVLGAASKRLRESTGSVMLFGAAVAVVAVVIATGIDPYWEIEISEGPGGLTVGVTDEGHAWIGASQPTLEIIEYSDYECPHCRTNHTRMRQIVAEHPDEVRLVHRHYPLDNACNSAISRPFHVYACAYARMAICAEEQGHFWEANDFLYKFHQKNNPVSADRLAAGIDLDANALAACMGRAEVREHLSADIARGRQLGITGTPTYVVDGKVYPGWVPPEVLERIVSQAAPAERSTPAAESGN